jgi:hypothetical protein
VSKLALVNQQVAVVVKGNFNPSIFSPAWLLSRGVIGSEEFDKSEVTLITADVARFRCGWLTCSVTRDTLEMSTSTLEEFGRVRDATVVVLESLIHTPISALGINYSAHFAVASNAAWHAMGDLLAPKAIWEDCLKLPGMRSLTMFGARPGLEAGRIQVVVEPSAQVRPGIAVGYNDHYELVKLAAEVNARDDVIAIEEAEVSSLTVKIDRAIETLRDDWTNSAQRFEKVMRRLHKAAEEVSK